MKQYHIQLVLETGETMEHHTRFQPNIEDVKTLLDIDYFPFKLPGWKRSGGADCAVYVQEQSRNKKPINPIAGLKLTSDCFRYMDKRQFGTGMMNTIKGPVLIVRTLREYIPA